MGGPSVQGYAYDPYYRLIGATGSYRMAPNKVREYAYALGYDAGGHGNVVLKHQLDEIVQGRNRILQRPTSYTFNPITYAGDGPHQMTRIATLSYSYDVNGNATGWTDDATGQRRTHTFDAEDRLTSIADQGSTTTYTYDAQHQLAIERGPGGETSFVNPWYTVRNGAVAWKHVFAGDQRIATQRAFDDGSYEHMRYFLHADLLGSTNLLTDDRGLVFQHLEYFPSGEIWVHEHSDVHRTPYLYTGEYFDEVRRVLSLGRRWYDPREQRFYTPDPVLYADPLSVVDDPALLPAYSYAESNPLRLVDRDGLQPGDPRDDLAADPSGGSAAAPPVPAAQDPSPSNDASVSRVRAAKAPEDSRRGRLQAFSERFAAKPLIQVNLNRGPDGWSLQDVKLAPLFTGPQLTIANAGGGRAQRGRRRGTRRRRRAGGERTPVGVRSRPAWRPPARAGGCLRHRRPRCRCRLVAAGQRRLPARRPRGGLTHAGSGLVCCRTAVALPCIRGTPECRPHAARLRAGRPRAQRRAGDAGAGCTPRTTSVRARCLHVPRAGGRHVAEAVVAPLGIGRGSTTSHRPVHPGSASAAPLPLRGDGGRARAADIRRRGDARAQLGGQVRCRLAPGSCRRGAAAETGSTHRADGA